VTGALTDHAAITSDNSPYRNQNRHEAPVQFRRPSVGLCGFMVSGVAGTVFVCIIIPRRPQRQVISGDMSKVKYCSFGGGCPVTLGDFWFSGDSGTSPALSAPSQPRRRVGRSQPAIDDRSFYERLPELLERKTLLFPWRQVFTLFRTLR
jgi:hypothetical protein